MSQQLLFDNQPAHCAPRAKQAQPATKQLARASDPPTSQQAAQETGKKLNAMHRAFIDVLKSLARPATASEVAEICHQREPSSNRESYRKRAKECCDRHAIKIAGTKHCEITAKTATAYIA